MFKFVEADILIGGDNVASLAVEYLLAVLTYIHIHTHTHTHMSTPHALCGALIVKLNGCGVWNMQTMQAVHWVLDQ